MDVLNLISQPFRAFGAMLSNISGLIYGTLAFIAVMVCIITSINFGPSGFITTGPIAFSALILRKLNQMQKGS